MTALLKSVPYDVWYHISSFLEPTERVRFMWALWQGKVVSFWEVVISFQEISKLK